MKLILKLPESFHELSDIKWKAEVRERFSFVRLNGISLENKEEESYEKNEN
jgi:hypothetical protein